MRSTRAGRQGPAGTDGCGGWDDGQARDPFLDGKPSAHGRVAGRPAHTGEGEHRHPAHGAEGRSGAGMPAAPRAGRGAAAPAPGEGAPHAPARRAPGTRPDAGTPAPAAHGAAAPAKARVASLDGLRTFAILAVVAYHLGLPWLPSGHMGVVVFLVLTGYLVTNSVLRLFARDAKPSFGGLARFWLRRLRRLWPSLVAMVVLVGVACVAFDHVLLTKMRPDIVPSLLGFLNWSYVANGQSYFDQIGAPSPLTHLWYIGVDVQMCLAWPLVLFACLRAGAGRAAMRRACLVLALASAVLMGVLYDPSADPSRVYYGTDTRAFSVLLGAWLALAWPLGSAPAFGGGLLVRDGRATPLAHAAGAAALAGIVAVMAFVPASSAFFYYGGMLLVSLLAVVAVACLLVPGSALARLFALRPLVWFGSRSYAVYLWHYPLIQLLGAGFPAPWWRMLLAAALSVAAAELSWRLVEAPVADGRAGAGLRSLADALRSRRRPAALPVAAASASVAAAAALAVGCLVVPETTLVPEDAIVSTGVAVDQGVDLSQGRPGQQDAASQDPVGEAAAADPAAPADPAPQPQDAELPAGPMVLRAGASALEQGHYEPLLIGDSVPGDTPFYSTFPDGFIDSYIGRQPFQTIPVFQDYLDQGVVGRVVVFAAFSNSTPTPEQLDELVDMAGPDREVFLVGTVNPDGFQEQANQNLRECADRHANAYYVDWPATVAGHEDAYIYPDGTHLTPEGAPVYLDMIARAVAPAVVADGGTAEPAA